MGVAFVGFDALAGLSAGLGRRHDNRFEPKPDQVPGQHEASRSAMFVAELEVLENDLEFLGEFAQGILDIDERAFAGAVVDGVLTIAADGVCDGD